MTTIQAAILGIVQGVTEFLPVSSSGHLQIAKELLGVHITENLAFDVALHVGTVCSTILVLWSEIAWVFRGLFSFKLNDSHRYALKILVSMIPIAVVGFTCKDYLDALLSSSVILLIVGGMLLFTSMLLAFANIARKRFGYGHDVGFGSAFVIGIAQALAVIPGLSRSGCTIATGILLGNDRGSVAKFSFLMVLVPVLGNLVVDIVKGDGGFFVAGVSNGALLAGFVSAFVVGVLSCRFMIEIVKRGSLGLFSVYCALAGFVAVVEYFLNY